MLSSGLGVLQLLGPGPPLVPGLRGAVGQTGSLEMVLVVVEQRGRAGEGQGVQVVLVAVVVDEALAVDRDVNLGSLEQVVQRSDGVLHVVAEPPDVGTDDDVRGVLAGQRGLELLRNLLVGGAGRDDLDRDPFLGPEIVADLLGDVTGSPGIVGPEGDVGGGLDVGVVNLLGSLGGSLAGGADGGGARARGQAEGSGPEGRHGQQPTTADGIEVGHGDALLVDGNSCRKGDRQRHWTSGRRSLDRALGESGDEVTLEQDEDEEHWQDDEDGTGHEDRVDAGVGVDGLQCGQTHREHHP